MLSQDLLKRAALRAGSSGRFLEYIDGRRCFIQADTAWELGHRCTRDEAIYYMDTRKAQGFNAVLVVLIPELDCRGSQEQVDLADESSGSKVFYPNRQGHVPLINDNPATPNDEYFEHLDWLVAEMIERGIIPFLVPTWGRFINTAWNWGPILFDENNARIYGEYIGKRYPFCPKLLGGDINIDWISSGRDIKLRNINAAPGIPPTDDPSDYPSISDLKPNNGLAVIEAMAQGILASELPLWEEYGGKPMLSYHPAAFWMPGTAKPVPSQMLPNADWLALDGSQSGHMDGKTHYFKEDIGRWEGKSSWEPIQLMWDAKVQRPVIDLESHYEAAYNGFNPRAIWKWGEHDIRTGAWQSLCAGACGIVYGVNSVWQMWDPDRVQDDPWLTTYCGHDSHISWKSEMTLPGVRALPILREYFLSLPESTYAQRRPAQEYLSSTDAPLHTQAKDGRIDVMSADEAGWILAHSGQGFAFSLSVPIGSYSAVWIDPRSGERTGPWVVTGGENVRFEPPSGGDVSRDWLLELQRHTS